MARLISLSLIIAIALSGMVANVRADESGPTAPATSREASQRRTSAMKIRIKIQNDVITATMADNATSRDFVSLLPTTVTLNDYASTEKVTYLPRRLSIDGAPEGSDPSIGDITYYAPWGNLAIFYKDFGYSSGLIKLGKVDSGIEVLKVPGPMQATFELSDD
jgi:hypothetical protein